MTFVSLIIPASKDGRDTEIEAVNTFGEYIKNYHQDCIISECVLVLDVTMPYIRTSTDRLMSCLCCGKACIEMKCPHSINYTDANEQNLDYLYKDGGTVKLKQNKQSISRNALCKRGLQKPKMLTLWFGLRMEW